MVDEGDQQVLADRYRLTDSIGRGGMADVYSAEDIHSGRMVAVKVMRVGDAADPDRFSSEMAILDRLNHPAIVRLFDTGRTSDESPYFVMQLVQGESLSTRLREEGPVPEADIIKIAVRVAGALSHAHDMGVVHRDIKPANILIDETGRGFLTDFGVARLVDSTMVTRAGTTIGTAAYLAPEQLQDSSVGPAADVYSLGLVLIEAFTGRRSFRGSGVEAAMARLGRDPEIPTDLPDNWRGLLLAMTRRDPDRRPGAGFVEGVLRGRIPPPPLDPVELAARSSPANTTDDEPTAVTPLTGEQGSGSWDPPSGESGASFHTQAPSSVTPPPPPPSPHHDQPDSGSARPTDDRRPWRLLLLASTAAVVALAVIVIAVVFGVTMLFGDTSQDPVVGNSRVDDATREVLRVLDASEALRATDPSLQRRLRLLAAEMVESVNEDRYDGALLAAADMTTEIQSGIEGLDIRDVAFRPLLSALRDLTRQIQTEIESNAPDTS
ncbi:MAG: serine/threonine-protein kinase [Euzebya sp.]